MKKFLLITAFSLIILLFVSCNQIDSHTNVSDTSVDLSQTEIETIENAIVNTSQTEVESIENTSNSSVESTTIDETAETTLKNEYNTSSSEEQLHESTPVIIFESYWDVIDFISNWAGTEDTFNDYMDNNYPNNKDYPPLEFTYAHAQDMYKYIISHSMIIPKDDSKATCVGAAYHVRDTVSPRFILVFEIEGVTYKFDYIYNREDDHQFEGDPIFTNVSFGSTIIDLYYENGGYRNHVPIDNGFIRVSVDTSESTISFDDFDFSFDIARYIAENNEPYEIKADDYTLIKNENGCYLTFDDVSKYQNSSSGGILAADIEFKSIKEFKDVITKGGLTDIQKSIIAGFSTDGINIKTCDFHKLYEPSIPQGCSVGSVYWSGEFYIFDISLDNDAFGDIMYLTKDHYNQLYSYYENFFNNDLITITSVEDKDGTIITDYRTSSAILKNIRYTLETENKTVIIEKEYSIESPLNDIFGYIKDVPYAITLYCIDENNLYYKISLNELKEDPTDEWLLQFGLKPYIENDHEVM